MKQSNPSDSVLQACLEVEFSCGHEFQKNELLGAHVPKVFGYDEQRGILCSELLHDTQSMRQFQQTFNQLRSWLASKLGDSLAKFHSTDAAQVVQRLPQKAQHRVPTILRDELKGLSAKIDPAGIGDRIREYPDYFELIRKASSIWSPDGLYHGDIRWDNVLIKPSEPEPSLFIIDWELAGGGDSAWDVAGVVQGYLVDWVNNLIDLDELRELVSRFCDAYLARRGRAVKHPSFLRRVIVFSGCRLVQSTFEHHQFGSPLGDSGLQLLQLSWNVLREPEAIGRELLEVASLFDGSSE